MKKSEHELSTRLWNLSKKIIAKVHEYRSRGLLVNSRIVYVKPIIDDFNYNEGSASYKTSFKNIEREEWYWKDQHDFKDKIIKQFQEYKDCLVEIIRSYETTEAKAEDWLSRFCVALSDHAIEISQDNQIVEQITIFINDLDKNSIEWSPSLWLKGIWLEDDVCEISNRIFIRRPVPADLEIERPFDVSQLYESLGYLTMPSAIIELSIRALNRIDVQKEIDLLSNIFQLFRLGSVSVSRVEYNPKSILNLGGSQSSSPYHNTNYKYKFNKLDIELFNNLFNVLKPILFQSFIFSPNESDAIDISFKRYQEALLQPVSIESRITSGITCLEALFLKPEERMELAHRLGQRIAALLRFYGFTSIEIYKNVIRAYDIRSTFIHGSQIGKEQQQSTAKLCETILNYARVSLLVFYQSRSKLEKDHLINKLDNSLLDETAQTKLKDLLMKDIVITK